MGLEENLQAWFASHPPDHVKDVARQLESSGFGVLGQGLGSERTSSLPYIGVFRIL